MRWFRFIIVLLVITFLNVSDLLSTISLSSLNIRPDLLLISLVFFALNCTGYDAMVASFVIGFAADISGHAMGPYMISFGLFGTLISQLRTVVIMKKVTNQAIAIFFTGLLVLSLAHLLTFFKIREAVPGAFTIVLGTCAYSGAAGPLIWAILSAMSGWLGVRSFRVGRMSAR